MDRELTPNEKKEHQRKHGRIRKHHADRSMNTFSGKLLSWSLIILFLFMPMMVRYVAETLGQPLNAHYETVFNAESKDEAIIRVYAARTWGPKGLFAVHSWIAMKRQGSNEFEVSQVIGWRQEYNGNVLFRETGVPVDSWWGNEATLILELQGESVESIIGQVDVAIQEYPWRSEYRLYPGPNSNTFIAWIGLQVPELGLDLPSTAVGKDWRPLYHSIGSSVSGTGLQASLFGLLGTSIGSKEGIEINVLGLNFELDLFDLALELPLFGRYDFWYLLSFLTIWLLLKKWTNRTKSKYQYVT